MIALETTHLLPRAWSHLPATECYFFNPAITRFQDRIILAYRVVIPDGRRWLALCHLTPDLQIAARSAVPLSDSLQTGSTWHADARFAVFRDRLFLHYNDGSHIKPNHIYLVEIDPDTLAARGPARELILEGPRRIVEKNWILFAHDDELWAMYSISPHVVLRLEWTESGPVICRPEYRHEWDVTPYAGHFGQPRGGTPPLRVGDQYVSVFHSCYPVHRLRQLVLRLQRRVPDKTIRYVGGVYGFAAEPPFAPLWLAPTPVLLPPPELRRHRPQLDVRIERSAYPCGAIRQGGRWIVSFGSLEEYCCFAELNLQMLPGKWGNTE